MRSPIRYVGMGCLALLVLACGDKGDDTTTGGGGSSGSAGASATGGTAGNGGTAGTGGTADSGGTGGSGGTAADGGPSDSGRVITQSYNFDTDVQMWRPQYTSALTPAGDSGITAVPIADVMVTHDPVRGTPTAGALQAGIPYSSRSQYVGIGISYGSSVEKGVDLTGKIVTAKVQIVSGLGTAADLMTNPGGAKLYVKTGVGYVYAAGLFTNLSSQGNWIDLDFDMNFTRTAPSYPADPATAGVDVTDVRELGIQFDTGGMSTTASPAVLLIDSVSY